MNASNFVWNDGGRATSGFVGFAGDCVTRAISIATGIAYREVYDSLKRLGGASPRDGVMTSVMGDYLSELGWFRTDTAPIEFSPPGLPGGVVIAQLAGPKNGGHVCAVVEHVVHDTWNSADDAYKLIAYWTRPSNATSTRLPISTGSTNISQAQLATQAEFEKVLKRIKALRNTAKNDAATEAEQHNAIRMMQHLLLKNNLTENDLEDTSNLGDVGFTKVACPVNGKRKCHWESNLARYVTDHILPSVQYFISTGSYRTFIHFYGPRFEVHQAIEIFRELLLSIATSARLLYGGHSRGSGASYCEGYVENLPRQQWQADDGVVPKEPDSQTLIPRPSLVKRQDAERWLHLECGIKLVRVSAYQRQGMDLGAKELGRVHGASHEVKPPNRPPRIEAKP